MPKRRRIVRRQKRRRKIGGTAQEHLFRALNHPVRVRALTILSQRTASPKELSEQLEVPLPNVSYHVRVLDELGLVEAVEEEPVRGALAHFYRAVNRRAIDGSLWSSLDPEVRKAASGSIVERLIADAADSLGAEVFDRRQERHLSRTPLLLDEQGWRAVCRIQAEALAGIAGEEAAAAERLAGSEAEAIRAIVWMLCFEAAPEPPPSQGSAAEADSP